MNAVFNFKHNKSNKSQRINALSILRAFIRCDLYICIFVFVFLYVVICILVRIRLGYSYKAER